jgi:hypothetical protein
VSDDKSFAKYEAEVAIRLYGKGTDKPGAEPQRKDFVTEAAYRACLEVWLKDVEEVGEKQLESLFKEYKGE